MATAIALTGSVAACGDDDDGPTTPANIAGTYTLQTINGTPLPFTIGGGVIVQSSTLTLDQALGFLVRVVGTANGTPGGFDDDGIYARNNNALQFTSADFDDFTGTVSGRTVTIQYDYGDGVVRTAVYTR